MTATLPAGQAPPSPVVPPAPGPRSGHRRAPGARQALSTPTALRGLLVALVLLSLAWGAFGGWVASDHSSAASAVVNVDEPLSLDAQQMYQSIADADATITAAFLSGAQPTLPSLQRYQADINSASADLAKLRAAEGGQADKDLAALSGGLPAYTGYIGEARTEYAMGYPLTGGSFLQVASEQAHLTLLPAASAVFARENAALNGASSQATGLPLVIVAVALAIVTGYVLFRAQRWLTRRTNRLFNPGLVLASLLLVISTLWLLAGFLSARSDLDRGINDGAAPAESLALASTGVQQIRGDAVLNVISRSGSASFADDFLATSAKVGPAVRPGQVSWLDSAAAAQDPGGAGARLVDQAKRDATAWYATNKQVYKLDAAANYQGERNLVASTKAGGLAAGYTALRQDISQAIVADQAVFTSAATSGASSLDPLAGVVIASSLLMALGCAWAIVRRLAEYR